MTSFWVRQDNKDLRSALRECFKSDPELLEKWHIAAPADLDACVEKTVEDAKAFDPGSFKFYRVFNKHEIVGYWGTEHGSYINLIFVKPKHRTPEFMKMFWDAIQQSLVSDKFATAVYAKNKPAIQFYKKFGRVSEHIEFDGHPVVLFEFHKERKCL